MNLIDLSNSMNRRYRIANIHGKSNYHTHTYLCDGKNPPREMVERAVELGFSTLGFSGHQYSVQDSDYAMSPISELRYKDEILALKEEFKDQINIYLGIERDYCCETTQGYDYVIGSTHHLLKDGIWMSIDHSPGIMEEGVKKLFDGDYMAYIETYYELESKVLEKTGGQIVGHFDLVTVFNQGYPYFDEKDPAYIRAAKKSMEGIVDDFVSNKRAKNLPEGFPEELGVMIETTGMPIFEINTGATAKGRKDLPYPAPFLVEYLADMGVPMVMNSDCHDKRYLDFGFDALINRYK